jgi:uncharacterized repeat protein (TIGR02543 family)
MGTAIPNKTQTKVKIGTTTNTILAVAAMVFFIGSAVAAMVAPIIADDDINRPLITRTLTVAKNGSGKVYSTPTAIFCGSVCKFSFMYNTRVSLTVIAEPGATFVGWGGACTGTSNICSVLMGNNLNVVANFTNYQPTLSVSKSGTGTGLVVSNDVPGIIPKINCGSTCSASYAIGTTVTLTARPDTGSIFTSWSGCNSVAGMNCTVSMQSSTYVTATFTRPTNYSLSLLVTPSVVGGYVTINPGNIKCDSLGCNGILFTTGTQLTFTASPNLGYMFSWGGDLANCTGPTCNLTMNNNKYATIVFTPKPVTVSVEKSGQGSVASNPIGINCGTSCSASFPRTVIGQVTLTATPAVGYEFIGWNTACSPGTALYICSVVATDGQEMVNVTATFRAITKPIVTTDIPIEMGDSFAQLAGVVEPNGSTTTAWFRYQRATPPTSCSDTDDFGIKTLVTNIGSGAYSGYVNFSTNVTNLDAGITYYYCAIAQNAGGTSYGTIRTFKAGDRLFYVTTGAGYGLIGSADQKIYCSFNHSVGADKCRAMYSIGATVELWAQISTGTDHVEWNFSSGPCPSGQRTCNVPVTSQGGSIYVTMVPRQNANNLGVEVSGNGVGIVLDGYNIRCDKYGRGCYWNYGSPANITLYPDSGLDSVFVGWTGCDNVSGSTCTVSMGYNDIKWRNIKATFVKSNGGS